VEPRSETPARGLVLVDEWRISLRAAASTSDEEAASMRTEVQTFLDRLTDELIRRLSGASGGREIAVELGR
jgi:hypothetical protein